MSLLSTFMRDRARIISVRREENESDDSGAAIPIVTQALLKSKTMPTTMETKEKVLLKEAHPLSK